MTVSLGHFGGAFICGSAPRRHRCNFCQRLGAENQCDFVVGDKCKKCRGSGRYPGLHKCHSCVGTVEAMCNLFFCADPCGVRVSEDVGYCPEHQAAAGYPVNNTDELCYWLDQVTNQQLKTARCLHQGCGHMVQRGDRCLYFPKRARVMDAHCGAQYLQLKGATNHDANTTTHKGT